MEAIIAALIGFSAVLLVTVLSWIRSDIKSDVGGLKSDVAEVKSDVAGLKSDMAEVKSDVAGLKSDMAEVKSDVGGLKSDVTEVRTEIAANAAASDKEFGKVHEALACIVELLRGQGERIARLEGREEARKETRAGVPV